LAVLDLSDRLASLELFDLSDDILCEGESLAFQLGEDKISIQHHFKGLRTTHLSADEGGRIRIKDLISEFLIARTVASGAAVLHIHLNDE